MLKDYLSQLYTEGLATIFYIKPTMFIDRKVKNKKLANILKFIIKIIYTLAIMLLAVAMIYNKIAK